MQADIFSQTQHSTAYAELCCALYEREIAQLSYAELEPNRVKNRLRSLPFYIQKAAWGLILNNSPLTLDTQNASWHVRQASKPPQPASSSTLQAWIDKYVAPGLPLPVKVERDNLISIHLDSVDRIDYNQQRLHLNRFGWFNFDGSLTTEQGSETVLMKPTKATMSAACGGHLWSQQGKLPPQALPLRELLLSTLLDWPTFTRVRSTKGSVAGLFN